MVRQNNNLEQWVKFFLNGVIETALRGKETFRSIIDLRQRYEQKIMTLGRKTKAGNSFLLQLFSEPIISAKKTAENLDIGFPAANRLISDFIQLGILKEITGYSRNRLFALSEYLDLFRKWSFQKN